MASNNPDSPLSSTKNSSAKPTIMCELSAIVIAWVAKAIVHISKFFELGSIQIITATKKPVGIALRKISMQARWAKCLEMSSITA